MDSNPLDDNGNNPTLLDEQLSDESPDDWISVRKPRRRKPLVDESAEKVESSQESVPGEQRSDDSSEEIESSDESQREKSLFDRTPDEWKLVQNSRRHKPVIAEIAKEMELSEEPPSREPLIDDTVKCLRHSTRAWRVMIPHDVKVPLRERLIDDSQLEEVQQCLRDDETDFAVISAEGKIMRMKLLLLRNCSRYFRCLAQSFSHEAEPPSMIKLRITAPSLRTALMFMIYGEVTITINNVQKILLTADYLQIEPLQDGCRRFLENRLSDIFEVFFNLVHFCDLIDLTEVAMCKLCDSPKLHRNALIALDAYVLSHVIRCDDLNVDAEDEVVDLVIDWCNNGLRSPADIDSVLIYIRYPHLSVNGLKRLVQSGLAKSIYLEKCLEESFAELPEEQLTPRSFYHGHLHMIWVESEQHCYRACVPQDPDRMFSVRCLRYHNGNTISNSLVEKIPADRLQGHHQFLHVKKSLQYLTISEDDSQLFLNRQSEDSSWAQVAIARRTDEITLAAFTACVANQQVFVNLLEEELWPYFLKVNATESWPAACAMSTSDVLKDSPLFVLRMELYQDTIILMGRMVVELHDTKTQQKTSLKSTTTYRGAGTSYMVTFSEMVRVDDHLYVYEDVPCMAQLMALARNEYYHFLCDRLHIINLVSKELEQVVEMKLPLWTSMTLRGDPCHEEKMFVNGSRLIMVQHEHSVNHCKLAQFDLETRSFSKLVDVPTIDNTADTVQFRQLEASVPTYLHACRDESLLQAFCRISNVTNDDAVRERFARYLSWNPLLI